MKEKIIETIKVAIACLSIIFGTFLLIAIRPGSNMTLYFKIPIIFLIIGFYRLAYSLSKKNKKQKID